MMIKEETFKMTTIKQNIEQIKPKSDFWADRKIGQEYENKAQDRLRAYNPQITSITTNNDYKFDLIASPDNLKYEIKYDRCAIRTGRFYVEFVGYERPETTEADFYIMADGKYWFLIPTSKLKEIVEDCEIMKSKNGTSIGYLLPRVNVIKNSTVI
jgi:hypothetical protein